MRNRRIVLLDVGLDAAFDASMQFAQGLLGSINAGWGDRTEVDVDFVRSRDLDTVFSTLTTECNVLHVMAHGDADEGPSFVSTDGKVAMRWGSVADAAELTGRGVATGAIIADGCRTATGPWKRAIRDCLQGPITYVGTRRVVGWFEGTVFASCFYAALLRNRGSGISPAQQAKTAAERAIDAYEALTDKACPYVILELTPSRRAKRNLGS